RNYRLRPSLPTRRSSDLVIRVLVDRACFPHHHIVQVSRESRKGQLAGLQFITELYHFMPGFPYRFAHCSSPILLDFYYYDSSMIDRKSTRLNSSHEWISY